MVTSYILTSPKHKITHTRTEASSVEIKGNFFPFLSVAFYFNEYAQPFSNEPSK